MLTCYRPCAPIARSNGLRQQARAPSSAWPRRHGGSKFCAPQSRSLQRTVQTAAVASADSTWGHPDALRRREEAASRREQRRSDVEALRAANNSWWQVQCGQNMATVNTCEEYAAALARCKEESPLVVVDFFAPWCSGCRALYPKLRQIASANLDVAFIKVNTEVAEMRELADELGVIGLPFFNLHSACGNHVQAFTANLTKINRLRAEIDIMKQEYQMAVEDWMES